MKRVAVLAYYFPPIGGAGAQRPLKIAKALPDDGWEPVIVTGAGPTPDRWAPADLTLADEIRCEVRRIAVPEPPRPGGWRGRIERLLAREDAWTRWWRDEAERIAVGLEGIDVVYSWMQPYESGLLGARVAERLGVPYVADLGDPWALDEMLVFPSALHRRIAMRRMREALLPAAAVVMSTPEAATRVVAAIPELADRTVVAIPNGFDPDDFAGLAPDVPTGGPLRIVHTGYLHTEIGLRLRARGRVARALGGAVPGLDILTRSHVFLLEAVERVLADDPDGPPIEVHLAGVLSPTDREIAARYPFVHLEGYVDHAASIALLRGADLLFLPMHDLPAGERATIVPGKTYEYIASGRPILAAVPDGDARDILAAAGTAMICRPADVDGLAAAIRAERARRAAGGSAPVLDATVAARFAYPHLGERLAGVFADVAAAAPGADAAGGRARVRTGA